ncbi:hypothetical protein CGCF413_v004257 [Colletotrichum fructicola]|nr:hypothetical protein CGCF413_v004257 [Colletotrichum fructicola]
MAADIISLLSFGQSFGMLGLGKSTLYMQAIENALLGAVFKSDPEIFHEPHQFKADRFLDSAGTNVNDQG